MSETKNENKDRVASEKGVDDNAADNAQADELQSSATGKQTEPNKISDDGKASDGHPPKKPEGSKLTVPAGTQGESSLYYNPKHKAYSRVGESSAQKINGKKKSWADAAREDDMMRGDYYDYYMQHMAALNSDKAANDMMRKNPEFAQQLHEMKVAEEEKAARRERIRARREEKLRTGGDESFEDAGARPKYYRTADGTVKKLPGFAREEFLESIKEGGVPVKSWLIIALAMGIGIYQLRKTIQQTEPKGNNRKGGASHAKARGTNKAKLGKKKRPSEAAPEPELDFELDLEPKRGAKQLKKKKSPKKMIVKKPPASPIVDTYQDDSTSSDTVDNDTPLATPSSGMANVSSAGDKATDELELKPAYNEDDRRAKMQVLSEEDGDDGWVTAGRKSKGAKKNRSPQTSSITNASEGAKEGASSPKAAAPNSKVTLPKSKFTPPSSPSPPSPPSPSSSKVNSKGPKAQPSPKSIIDTREEDAALARKLQKQEENMAARELGLDVEEEWEEVSSRKKGRKTNLTQPSTAISAN